MSENHIIISSLTNMKKNKTTRSNYEQDFKLFDEELNNFLLTNFPPTRSQQAGKDYVLQIQKLFIKLGTTMLSPNVVAFISKLGNILQPLLYTDFQE